MSDFRLQITHAESGRVVSWRPGIEIEADLIDGLISRLKKRGVGIFRSEKSVLAAVRQELEGLIWELKARV